LFGAKRAWGHRCEQEPSKERGGVEKEAEEKWAENRCRWHDGCLPLAKEDHEKGIRKNLEKYIEIKSSVKNVRIERL
tara:strand:+ start:104 stop:334 length:231 start_codon:yes stop_codon:yes gene_type:complete